MFNKIILVGRVGRDAELRNDKSPVEFSMATSDSHKDASGEWVENTSWHSVVSWGKPEFKQGLVSRIKKGDIVIVEGKSITESWENEAGEKRYTTKVQAYKVSKVPTGAPKQASSGGSGGYGEPSGGNSSGGGYSNSGPVADEQNLPF